MRARLVPAVLAACVAVAGCSGDEPDAGPTLPPVSGSPSASPSAVAVPTEATAATPEGAAEFVRFWFQTLNDAAADGDTRTLRSASLTTCETCNRFAESIEELYEPGGRIEGGVFTVTSVEAQGVPAGATDARALVVYGVSPTRQLGPDGQVLREVGELVNQTGELSLSREKDQWKLKEFS